MGPAPEMGAAMKRLSLILMSVLTSTAALLSSVPAHATLHAIVVAGLGGEETYEQDFRKHATSLAEAIAHLDDEAHVMLLIGQQAQLSALRRELQALVGKAQSGDSVMLMLVGHGSFDGEEYRFNIPGPDLTATELATLMNRIGAKEQLLVLASSASGGALSKLKRPGRIVIAATKSGTERNATRFAEHWVRALTTKEADVDKDEWVTIKEAFDYTERKVADAYKADASLATEHARMEATETARAERIPLARLGAGRSMPTDPELRTLFAERLRIEREVDAVKARKAEQKDQLPDAQYYDDIEKTLVELAKTQIRIDARQAVLENTEEKPRS
jgi:hypothetical protein